MQCIERKLYLLSRCTGGAYTAQFRWKACNTTTNTLRCDVTAACKSSTLHRLNSKTHRWSHLRTISPKERCKGKTHPGQLKRHLFLLTWRTPAFRLRISHDLLEQFFWHLISVCFTKRCTPIITLHRRTKTEVTSVFFLLPKDGCELPEPSCKLSEHLRDKDLFGH